MNAAAPVAQIPRPATTVSDPSIWTGTCYVNLLDPNPDEFHLADIARALSRIPRFNGLTTRFYSAAEHSVNCLSLFSAEWFAEPAAQIDDVWRGLARAVFLHDATEAYLGDVTRPLKAHLPDYRMIEWRMEIAMARRFDLPDAPGTVKRCDNAMLAAETAALMPGCGPWPGLPDPPRFRIIGLDPRQAEAAFLSAAASLGLE